MNTTPDYPGKTGQEQDFEVEIIEIGPQCLFELLSALAMAEGREVEAAHLMGAFLLAVGQTRLALERALGPDPFRAFMKPFVARLAELAGRPLRPEDFPLPLDAELAEQDERQRLAEEALYVEFLQAVRARAQQEREAAAAEQEGEGRLGVVGSARALLGRVRRHVWPLPADIGWDLVSEVSLYNDGQEAEGRVALAELAGITAAMENRGEITAPLRGLVSAIEATELRPMDEEDERYFQAALEKARKLLAASADRNRRALQAATAGEAVPTSELSASPVSQPGVTNYDPDRDPMWFIFCSSLFLTLSAVIPGVGIPLLVTRSLNSPWLIIGCIPAFSTLLTGLLCLAALVVKTLRLKGMGLYTDVEDDTPLEPEPLGRGAWIFTWCFLAIAAALSILFDGNLWAATAALVVVPLTVWGDLMGKQVTRAWVRQRLGLLVPVFAFPVAGVVILLAVTGGNENPSVFPPHPAVRLPTAIVLIVFVVAETLWARKVRSENWEGASSIHDASS